MNDGMLFDVGTGTRSDAELSPCGAYRYTLSRGVGLGARLVNFIMLNPSKADSTVDDPTICRCIGYTRDWGYGDLVVTNLFALRSTDPKGLRGHPDPVGPDNDRHLAEQARRAQVVVCAWGAEPIVHRRAPAVLAILRRLGITPHVLGLTSSKQPMHPLFKPASLVARAWELPGGGGGP